MQWPGLWRSFGIVGMPRVFHSSCRPRFLVSFFVMPSCWIINCVYRSPGLPRSSYLSVFKLLFRPLSQGVSFHTSELPLKICLTKLYDDPFVFAWVSNCNDLLALLPQWKWYLWCRRLKTSLGVGECCSGPQALHSQASWCYVGSCWPCSAGSRCSR